MSVKFNFLYDQVIIDYGVKKEEIEELKLWLHSEKLPKFTDEQILVFFLSCDKNSDATKTTIRSNADLVAKMPELFTNRNVDETHIQQYLSISNMCLLPKRTEDGCAVIYSKLKDFDYKKYNFAACFAVWIMCIESAIHDYPPTGCIFIADCEGFTAMYLSKIKLHLAKLLSQYFQNGLQVKLKAIHLLNSSWALQKLMTLMKPIVRSEVFNKIIIHPNNMDMNTFNQHQIQVDCLPLECGGTLPSVQIFHQKQVEKFKSMKEYFYNEEQLRKNVT